MEKKGLIYVVTNKINGKQYIGQTKFSLKSRKNGHFASSVEKDHNNYFHNSLRKYGSDNFDWDILENNIELEDLNSREVYYISELGTFENGYNRTTGGGCPLVSEKTREKMSNTRKRIMEDNRKKYGGYALSEETRDKMSKSKKGRVISKETREKMSKSKKGKIGGIGKIVSKETREKLSKANIGKRASKETRKKMSDSRMGDKNHFKGKHHNPISNKKNAISNINRGILSTNKSGFMGVSPIGKSKWRAVMRYNGDRFFLGQFDNKIDAAKVYDKKVIELYGDENVLTNKKLGLY